MNILLTICARAGSKGVQSKNTKILLGRQLIEYTLDFALASKKYFSHKYNLDIVVSSDSQQIKKIVNDLVDINFLLRSSEMSGDTYPKVPVIQQATKHMEFINNTQYDFVIDLDVTAPLRKVSEMEQIILQAESNIHQVIITAVPSRRNPYFNIVEIINNNAVRSKSSNFVYRQAAPLTYDLTPSFFCFNRNTLVNSILSSVFEVNCGIFEVPDYYVIDIDSEEDFETLEILIKYKYYKWFPYLFKSPTMVKNNEKSV